MRAITHLIIFVLVWLSANAYAAGQRGISVTLRQSESVNAPILEERELYQESYALVIGIDDYDNGWPRLSNAILDAELIAEALEAKGFDVELHRNPNSESLPQIFKRFFILKGENPEARLFRLVCRPRCYRGWRGLSHSFRCACDYPKHRVQVLFSGASRLRYLHAPKCVEARLRRF